MARAPKPPKQVTTLRHDEATRTNIPTAELQSFADQLEAHAPSAPKRYPRARPLAEGARRERDEDLDPQIIWNGARFRLTEAQARQLAESGVVEIGDAQLTWRGKDMQDWSDLVVATPPLYIQEKIHPKAIIDDLKRRAGRKDDGETPDLFADFNGLPLDARTEFYQHDQHWSNRMILGDSLQVMASLAEREKLAGKVQCIYFDPPYGIKFNSNWQVSTQSRDVKDGKQADLSREPEQVKAFRDTWKDGVHSYLTYLRDRLTAMRELLTESGSIFVQIGDENVHRVRAVMDEVFGDENFQAQINFKTADPLGQKGLPKAYSYIVWYNRDKDKYKFRQIVRKKDFSRDIEYRFTQDAPGPQGVRQVSNSERNLADISVFRRRGAWSAGYTPTCTFDFDLFGRLATTSSGKSWSTNKLGIERLLYADRLFWLGSSVYYKRLASDYDVVEYDNNWDDKPGAGGEIYVVQTATKFVQRCILMTTDPGDLVLDPTCGSGTTAYVAEQWGRRWITLDTSRVALALARTRLMSARYPYYLLADSPEGRRKEQEVSGQSQPIGPTAGDLRQGFVYERAPHVTLKSIANNAEIDVIWEEWQARLEPLRAQLNAALGKAWEEWEIPREAGEGWPPAALPAHAAWWEGRIARQREIDASIARRADVELLYDRPYVDTNRVRVAGPFTVESLSPHRIVPSDEDELLAEAPAPRPAADDEAAAAQDFTAVVLENLRTAGVQQSTKAEKIVFTALSPWPGRFVAAEGRYIEGDHERRAAIFIGPEFGTASRADIVEAAREAVDARFDVLICAAFNFEAHASEMTQLGALRILRAKISPDLHMAGELKNTGKGNLFIVFGEPDIEIDALAGDELQVRVKGVDVFDPNTGDVRCGDIRSIAAWFIDTDYDQESFFVRHAYFLGANDPYKALKTALRAEIDEAAWETLYRDTSRPFARPGHGRIAVKVINHFGDEVMKVFRV